MARRPTLHFLAIRLSRGLRIKPSTSGKSETELHCSHSSRSQNEARKEGRRGRSLLSYVFFLLPVFSHERVNDTDSAREPHDPPPGARTPGPRWLRTHRRCDDGRAEHRAIEEQGAHDEDEAMSHYINNQTQPNDRAGAA
jgi:hypothetical protein